MKYMFYGMTRLNWIDLSFFKTSKVTNMEYMFSHCENIESIYLDNFDTSNVETMEEMFSYCSTIDLLNLTSFNTKSVKTTRLMFYRCSNLIVIDEHFTSESLVDAYGMFFNSKVYKIDLSGFVGEKLENMDDMFYNVFLLRSVDLSNFIGEKISDTNKIFRGLIVSGTILYNSLKINKNVLLTLPSSWTKVDVNA